MGDGGVGADAGEQGDGEPGWEDAAGGEYGGLSRYIYRQRCAMVLKGVVRGKMIQLEQSPNLPDGQKVKVVVHVTESSAPVSNGEGLHRSFGGWAEDASELDEFLEWNRKQRKEG